MDKDSKVIWRFAPVGFVVAALVFSYLEFVGLFDAFLYECFAVICPPALLLVFLRHMTDEKVAFIAIWVLIGLTNAGLYAVIGAAYVGLRRNPQ